MCDLRLSLIPSKSHISAKIHHWVYKHVRTLQIQHARVNHFLTPCTTAKVGAGEPSDCRLTATSPTVHLLVFGAKKIHLYLTAPVVLQP